MKRKLRRAVVISGLVAFTIFFAVYQAMGAIWDETTAVHINAAEIENSTFAIGTHLIHLTALTDTINDIAQESVVDSGQDRIYYKSELGGGAWFDITEASTLADITTGGSPVADSVIEELFFTHHTKSDGITYDLRTGEPVSPFDIISPYDLESMDELFPLKTQYDLMKETQMDSKAGKAKVERVRQFFATNVENQVTNEIDKQLEALEVYYNILAEFGADVAEKDAVRSVQAALDASRRAQVFVIVGNALQEYALELQSIADSEDEEGNVTEGTGGDTSLQSAVNDSISNVSSSLIIEQGLMLSEGVTILSAVRYEYSIDLIRHAEENDHSSCDADVQNLIHRGNIQDGIVAVKESELKILRETLLTRGTEQYTSGLGLGINDEYRNAIASNQASAILRDIASRQTSVLNTYRSELEFFIDAITLRVTIQEGIDFVSERLQQTYRYPERIPNDAFFSGANTSVDLHIEFLSNLLADLIRRNGGTELDLLLAEKSDLQQDLLSALDNNDLQTASEIENKISDLDGQIQDMENEQLDQLDNLNSQISDLKDELAETSDEDRQNELNGMIASLEAERDMLEAGMSDGTLSGLVTGLKTDGMNAILGAGSGGSDGSDALGDLNGIIDSLGALIDPNHKLVFPVLVDMHQAMDDFKNLNDSDIFDDAMAKIEELIIENRAAYNDSLKDSLSAKDLEAIGQLYFSGFSPVLDFGDQGIIEVLALKMYVDATSGEDAAQLMRAKAQKQINLANPLIYNRIDDGSMRYIPVTAISRRIGMRYVWNQNRSQAVLARGSAYYAFTMFSDTVIRSKDETLTEFMTVTAKFLKEVHIPEDYAEQSFSLWAVYIPGTKYGVLCDEELNVYAEELLALYLS